jgi:hypothetical protein
LGAVLRIVAGGGATAELGTRGVGLIKDDRLSAVNQLKGAK